MSTCRSCNAPVLWAITTAGKPMPIDAEPVEDGNLVIVGTELHGSQQRVRYLAKDETTTEPRYVSHFATCPQREAWRKRQGAKT